MLFKRRLPFVLALLLLWAAPAFAAEFSGDPAKLPPPTGHVNDLAGMLSDTTSQQLEGLLVELEQKTGAQVAILTVTTLGGREPNAFGVAAYQRYGLGHKGKDDGVLFLIAPTDRKMFINTGYGVEDILPDAICQQIYVGVREYFRAGRMDAGVIAGTVTIAQVIAKSHNVTLVGHVDQEEVAPRGKRLNPGQLIMLMILLFFVISVLSRTGLLGPAIFFSGRGGGFGGGFGGGGFGGGGGGGGFGGFGGGSTGGGGAGGSW
jgi:uncharacterized protein